MLDIITNKHKEKLSKDALIHIDSAYYKALRHACVRSLHEKPIVHKTIFIEKHYIELIIVPEIF